MKSPGEIANYTRNKAFVVFRKPEQNEFHLVTLEPHHVKTPDNIKEEGFYLAPFDIGKHPLILFPRNVSSIAKWQTTAFEEPNNDLIFKDLNPSNHIQKVEKAVSLIKQNKIQKLVISSVFNAQIRKFEIWKTYFKLAAAYPASFVYYWHWPGHFSMLGATPEVLLQYEGQHGTVYSLAGTKFTDENRDWSPKETEEQAIVTRYIKNKLLAWQYPFSVDGPYEIRQGHLLHLRTDFHFLFTPDMHALRKIIKGLHPTPAVSGHPKNEAVKLIPEIETHDREYYTGFIGSIAKEEGELFVNLRSMKVTDNQLRIYAGGGITAGSEPEKEWQEVVRKAEIIKKILI